VILDPTALQMEHSREARLGQSHETQYYVSTEYSERSPSIMVCEQVLRTYKGLLRLYGVYYNLLVSCQLKLGCVQLLHT
jgi:hypothetical protein